MCITLYGYIYIVWGWTDEYNHEIVIAGCYSGTSFIDISVPEDPYIVCTLPAYPSPSSWRDIKVHRPLDTPLFTLKQSHSISYTGL